MISLKAFIYRMEDVLFGHRRLVLGIFIALTLALLFQALRLNVDEGFEKQLPSNHPYIDTFLEYKKQFGNANRVVIAFEDKSGSIFNEHFFAKFKKATDEVFFLEGVDRASVKSIFTPNTRFIEIIEDGFAGGNVVPPSFIPDMQQFATVKENIIKAGIFGRLVANDFSGAIISASLLERDPITGEKLDYMVVADQLEKNIRGQFQDDQVTVHIIGFAKVVGDIGEGVVGVIAFFAIAILITFFLVYYYCHSKVLSLILIICSLIAVVWQLGLLVSLGYGIDPMSILIPFLIFAIAVSHGVQMVNAIGHASVKEHNTLIAAKKSFRRMAVPGTVALITDAIGFLTIILIKIPIIQELAITASLGVATIIITNVFILPLLLSYCRFKDSYREKIAKMLEEQRFFWKILASFTKLKVAIPTVLIAATLYGFGLHEADKMVIGDMEAGVPEFWPDSRYNKDSRAISDKFSIGTDVIQVIAETHPDACIDFKVMRYIDEFDWYMQNVEGVQSTISLASVMKRVNAGWNEGNLKWHGLSRTPAVLVRSVAPVETSTGLLNANCSVMPIMIFTKDHRAETIDTILGAVEQYTKDHPMQGVELRLATGNIGVMAAINEAVEEAQFPMLFWVYFAVTLFCLINFRSVLATFCTVVPLTLVSVLSTALMVKLNIGLKISTLPVIALGVGIGVDYGIYIFSNLKYFLSKKMPLYDAYLATLNETGGAVIFTGITLAVSVSTWIFSSLKFQADMGILLSFMFLVNMIGAILLLPALFAVSRAFLNLFIKKKYQ